LELGVIVSVVPPGCALGGNRILIAGYRPAGIRDWAKFMCTPIW